MPKRRPNPFDVINSVYNPELNPYMVVVRRDIEEYFSVIAFDKDGRMTVLHDYEIEGYEG